MNGAIRPGKQPATTCIHVEQLFAERGVAVCYPLRQRSPYGSTGDRPTKRLARKFTLTSGLDRRATVRQHRAIS
jgi:hypothetical protein